MGILDELLTENRQREAEDVSILTELAGLDPTSPEVAESEKGVVQSVIDEPSSAAPLTGEILGGILGTTFGIPGIAVGSMLGRGTGELIRSLASGEAFATGENVYEILGAGAFSLIPGIPFSAIRNGMRSLKGVVTEVAEPIVRTGIKEAGEEGLEQSLRETYSDILLQREAVYRTANPTIPGSVDEEAAKQAVMGGLETEWRAMNAAQARLDQDLRDDFLMFQRALNMAPDRAAKETRDKVTKEIVGGAKEHLGPLAYLTNPQVNFAKSGSPNAVKIGETALAGAELETKIVNRYVTRGLKVFDQHKITDKEWPLFVLMHHDPSLVQRVKNGDMIRRFQGFDQETAQRVAGAVEDLKLLNDDLMYMQLMNSPDPEKIAAYRPGFIFSTSASKRELNGLIGDLKRYTAMIPDAPESLKKHLILGNERLLRRIDVIQEAAEQSDEAIESMAKAFKNAGVIPNRKSIPSHLEKTDPSLVFGPDMKSTFIDYVRGVSRQIRLDATMEVMKREATAITDPRLDKGVADFIFHQTGAQNAIAHSRYAQLLNEVPGLKGKVSRENVRNTFNNINKFVYAFQLGLNPRFAPVNTMQHLLTTGPAAGFDNLAQGIYRALTQWKALGKEAFDQGVLQSDISQALAEGTITPKGRLFKVATAIPEFSEKFNRLVAYATGKVAAEKQGLVGQEAMDFAKDLTRFTQFGRSTAERAPIGVASPIGNVAFRFRQFTFDYGNFLGQLYRTDKQKFATALTVALGMGGTAAMPVYSALKTPFAAATGVALPELNPIKELTGVDLGLSVNPFFTPPGSFEELAGPVLGPAGRVAFGAVAQKPEEIVRGIQRLGGPSVRLMQSIAEAGRGGVTRTKSGKRIADRDPAQIALAALSLGPTVRQERARLRREMEIAVKAGDRSALRRLRKEAKKAGMTDIKGLVSQAKGAVSGREDIFVRSLLGLR